MMLESGQCIAGKYRVERVIGRGGVGIVAAAHHEALCQRVALKFLRPELAKNAKIVQRFLREAQAAAQIRSEHVARVMDATVLDDGTAFLVMEYLEGRDLSAVLIQEGPLSVQAACDCILQACDALGEAHARGMVHRDLKPSNLFLTETTDGTPLVKVLDFGLTKVSEVHALSALTLDTHIMGSPHFMSPEQLRSPRGVDARSDIWSLGVTLYALLTARVPFEGDSLPEICAAVMTATPAPLTPLRADVPKALEEAVFRCMARDPSLRFASVAELAAALLPFASGENRRLAGRIAKVLGGRTAAPLPAPPPASEEATMVTVCKFPTSTQTAVESSAVASKGSSARTARIARFPAHRRLLHTAWMATAGGAIVAFAVGLGSRGSPSFPATRPAAAIVLGEAPSSMSALGEERSVFWEGPTPQAKSVPVQTERHEDPLHDEESPRSADETNALRPAKEGETVGVSRESAKPPKAVSSTAASAKPSRAPAPKPHSPRRWPSSLSDEELIRKLPH